MKLSRQFYRRRKTFYLLTKNDPVYGAYSSYYSHATPPPRSLPSVFRISSSNKATSKLIGKTYNKILGCPRDPLLGFSELTLILRNLSPFYAGCHILNIEDHLPLLKLSAYRNLSALVSVHFPPSLWSSTDIESLSNALGLIVLCKRDQRFFRDKLNSDRVFFVRHGVNTNYFMPNIHNKSSSPRVIFVGKWLRDFDTASKVIYYALREWPTLTVDIVCQRQWFSKSPMISLLSHDRVTHYDRVDDSKLLLLYQKAWFLLVPFVDTSANNAICEALSCGVIPLVNDVGGVPDYGGGSLYPMSSDSSVKSYLDLLAYYISHPNRFLECSLSLRYFAQEKLDWSIVQNQHLSIYSSMYPSIFSDSSL
jgi:glycosyltransferase involved in cell wall biosynthesis